MPEAERLLYKQQLVPLLGAGQLRDRDPETVLASLDRWVNGLTADDGQLLCEALWVQQGARSVQETLLQRLMASADYRVRAAAVYVLGDLIALGPGAPADYDKSELLAAAIRDGHPRVRLEALRAASLLNSEQGALLALDVLEAPVDYWVDYTLRHTMLALQPRWLPRHVRGEFAASSSQDKRDYVTKLLDSLGPSRKAIPSLQTLADRKSPRAARDGAVAQLAGLIGDPKNGEVVFNRVCSSCHKVNGRGLDFGPNLAEIREHKSPDQLKASVIYSILEPNLEVAPKYQTRTVTTNDGSLLSGFLESSDQSSLQLRMAGGKLARIPRSAISKVEVSSVSSMPEGLGYSVSPEEFLDLVEYIVILNQ